LCFARAVATHLRVSDKFLIPLALGVLTSHSAPGQTWTCFALATAGLFDKGQSIALANLSRWAFLLTFAGVGLKTDFVNCAARGSDLS
jgi:hypothetical protein